MKNTYFLIIIIIFIPFYIASSQSKQDSALEIKMAKKLKALQKIADGDYEPRPGSGAYGTITYLTKEQLQEEALQERNKNEGIIGISLIFGVFGIFIIFYFGRKSTGLDGSNSKKTVDLNNKSNINDIKNSFLNPQNVTFRIDGYYKGEFKTDEDKLIYHILFFTSKGFVACGELVEFDITDLTKDDYKQIIAEGEDLNEIEVSPQLTKFFKRGEDIAMKFYDPKDSSNIDPMLKEPYSEPVTYKEWSGKIIPNGLLLDLKKREYCYALKDYKKRNIVSDLKFKFVPINMN